MTVLSPPPGTAAGPGAPASDAAPRALRPEPAADARFAVPGAALTILAALLLGFAANLTVVGHLKHARDQQTGFAELRKQLALGTAPVGQTGSDGHLLRPGTPVAVLRIPALGLREVVFEGTTSGVLVSGPGHRRDTPLPGQAGTSVVMGRQWGYGSPFNHIDRLQTGLEIRVATGQGKHVYRVTAVRRAGDPVPAPLTAGHGRLTLITATGAPYTPSGVLRVDADLVTPAQPSPARPLAPGAVSEAERPLGGDGSAWLPMALWSQLLLAAVAAVVWARRRWGQWQAWIVGFPVLSALGIAVCGAATRLLPNLL
ncbi:sortase [Wenjunlia tyrosinilytica]|uniref:Sortase n=1 Tax=Wenjunlia tyrosinilytica TaxID=1544741 RepID=A0A917ZH75_9ACTN|nr:class E sortase [Wenjunlia tyrosinilytica]GGO83178.1 sortase [Wenjunlia tyrosinilytica]